MGIKAYDLDPQRACPKCETVCGPDQRDFSDYKVSFIGTKVMSPEYNPGLGTVVKNKWHKEELMKQKGVVEIGNDFGTGEKQQTHYETRKKEELEANWKKDGLDID
jgi:hypothetical protein